MRGAASRDRGGRALRQSGLGDAPSNGFANNRFDLKQPID